MFPVDEDVIAFAPPVVLILQDGHGDAHKIPRSRGLRPDEIVLSIKILFLFNSRIAVSLPLVRLKEKVLNGRGGVNLSFQMGLPSVSNLV
jgi:hypothetical protein